jgi:hypothetical protein
MAKKTVYRLSPQGESAVEKVIEQGFALPENPVDQPHLPESLDDLDNKALMDEFALFTAWADYASAQVGLAVTAEREAELEVEWQTSLHYSDNPKGKTSVTLAKAEALQNPDVYEARKKLDEAYAYRRLVSELAARYERDAAVLSRELTRRTSEMSPKVTRRDRFEA